VIISSCHNAALDRQTDRRTDGRAEFYNKTVLCIIECNAAARWTWETY